MAMAWVRSRSMVTVARRARNQKNPMLTKTPTVR
jgi:hypothetical protein